MHELSAICCERNPDPDLQRREILALVKGGVFPESRYVGKVSLAAGLGLFFLWELIYANLRLARDVITPHYSMSPGIVAVPLDATRDSEIMLLAALINLTPGSVALDVSPDRGHLYVHVMYMTDPEAARATWARTEGRVAAVREALRYQFPPPELKHLLVTGENVLAVQGLNSSAADGSSPASVGATDRGPPAFADAIRAGPPPSAAPALST